MESLCKPDSGDSLRPRLYGISPDEAEEDRLLEQRPVLASEGAKLRLKRPSKAVDDNKLPTVWGVRELRVQPWR